MVAMRVVNNVEREVMRAEWENWLLDENAQCSRLLMMLRENQTNVSTNRKSKGADSQQVVEATKREKNDKMEDLRRWQAVYCESCKTEQNMLLKGRKHLTFG